MENLFRKEAVQHATVRLSGDVLLATPVSAGILAALGCGFVAAVALLLANLTYARKEVATGWLVPERGLLTVTTREGGQVAEVFVHEGDTVGPSAKLVRLLLGDSGAQLDARSELGRARADEQRAAQARFAAGDLEVAAERARLRSRRGALRKQIDETERRVTLQDERLMLAKRAISRTETLVAQGYGASGTVDTRRSEALAIESELRALQSQLVSLRRDEAEVGMDERALSARQARQNAEAAAWQAEFSGRAAGERAETQFIARAPSAARVLALPFRQGQSAPPGGTIAMLMPAASRLEAEIFVPSRAVGFIRPGQQVTLMYDAFPHERFGVGKGMVRSVSETPILVSEATAGKVVLEEPAFRVRVSLDRDSIAAYGRTIPLQVGARLRANIVIDQRSLWEWVFDPISVIRGHRD